MINNEKGFWNRRLTTQPSILKNLLTDYSHIRGIVQIIWRCPI